jgi:ubiquitin C-terminal hydrolase
MIRAGGHYTAHVLQEDGRWLHFNDAAVSFVAQGQVLNERPYLLVYQRSA